MPKQTRPPVRDGLRISETLTLPDEAATETFAILARRGKGKSYCASVMAEEFITAGLPVLIIDPLGVWWGLRSSADGKADGLPVVIFGGDHADVPLAEGSAELVADAIVENRFPAILDLSHFSKAAMRRFMAPFIERVYQRNRDPLHVIVDEADLLAPQRVQADGARLLGAMEDLQRRGRARGIGTTLITQRPAVLSKDVLTQAEVLIVLGMTGPRDVAAIDEWVRLHADEAEAQAVKSSLPSLPVGTAWVWSPSFLGVLEKVQIRQRHTFDSSATPKVGVQRVAPKRLAPVDLDRLGAQIARAAEQAADTDPKALRRRVKELEARLAAAESRHQGPDGSGQPREVEVRVEVPVEVPVLTDGDRAVMERLLADGEENATRIEKSLDAYRSALADMTTKLAAASSVTPPAAPAKQRRPLARPSTAFDRPARNVYPVADDGGRSLADVSARPTTVAQAAVTSASATGADRRTGGTGERLGKAERKILHVLASHGTRSTTQVAILAGYSHKSGGYRNALSSLRTYGYIDGRGEVAITEAGRNALGPYEELPSGEALRHWWQEHHLGKAERAIVDVLAEDYPAPVPVPEIAERAGYSATSGGFRNALSRLRTLELASGRGELVLNDALTNA